MDGGATRVSLVVGQRQLDQYAAIRRMEAAMSEALEVFNKETATAFESLMGEALRRKLDGAAHALDVQTGLIMAHFNRAMGRPF